MRPNYQEDGKWWVSPYNFHESVLSEMSLPADVQIHDATLRDGEQTPGVVFSIDDKIRIAQMLNDVGIDRIEAGMPAVSPQDAEAIKEISRLGLKSRIFTFARAMRQDIDKAVECGAHGVVVEVPIGYPKLKTQFRWTWKDVLDKSVDVVNHAKDQGLYVVFFPYDTTRARPSDLSDLCKGIVELSQPDSIGIVDTMGCATPGAIKHMVRWVGELTGGLPIEIHTHNDFGLGVATEIAAVEAGAQVVHSSANGIGERTGNAALEELILALDLLYGYRGKYRLEKLPRLGALVAELANIPIHRNKPVLGSGNFTRESGIGVNFVVDDPLVMFATHPELTGRKGEIVLGKKSGRASIQFKLAEHGLDGVTDDQLSAILDKVKQAGVQNRGLVEDEEFVAIVRSTVGAAG